MNQVSPKKLLNSKWTATEPRNKEKHFIVTEVEFDEQLNVVRCVVEAVMSKRETVVDWRRFKDASIWKLGWV